MAYNSSSLEKTGIWYGFLAGLCLIVFGIILQLTNLIHVPLLRFGFLLINIFFICLSIYSLKQGRDGNLHYLHGIGVGSITSIVATLMFAFFTLINVMVFGSDIIDVLRDEYAFGEYITLSSVFMTITMIGIVGGAITSFIAMQYFKMPDHKLTE
ncbi:MAG TPA: hypothetical protein VK927_07745 [Adhaeribacter sp.]|nr:hypothetical protein [Adhaeribacter sp.]